MQTPRVINTELPEQVRGVYDVATHTVWLERRLTQRERRCTLEHELVHAERGDAPLADPVANAKQEQLVHREAARRLIPVEHLADALRWAIEARELAECLDVDLPTLQARLDALNTAEREHLEQITRAKDWE